MSTVLSKYYKVLSLPEGASQAEIKRQYRKLALRYHPDKTGGDETQFLQIKEAYEYLTGKISVQEPKRTATRESNDPTKASRTQTNEERIRQAKQRQMDQRYKEHIQNKVYFEKLTSGLRWKTMKFAAALGLLLFTILMVEQILPAQHEVQRVTYFKRDVGVSVDGEKAVSKIYVESGESFYAPFPLTLLINDPDVILVKSPLFKNLRGIIPVYEKTNKMYRIQYSLGAHALLFCPLFLLPFCLIIFKRMTNIFTLLYQIALFGSLPLMLIFLMTNNRLVHLFESLVAFFK